MSREICKYYMHGACNKGTACRFSHDIQAPKSTVCSYYLAGNCSYGDKCRYDHVRPAGHPGAPSGPGRPAPPMTVPRPNMGPPGPGNMTAGAREFVPLNAMMGGMNVGGARPFHPSARAPAWQPPPPSGGYPPAQEEQDDWGYEDEEGNWDPPRFEPEPYPVRDTGADAEAEGRSAGVKEEAPSRRHRREYSHNDSDRSLVIVPRIRARIRT